MSDRHILRLSGPDTHDFLQGLVTNDVAKLSQGLVYAGLLTPQGKYIADFFLAPAGDAVLLDISAALSDTVMARLSMYKLRAQVEIERTDMHVHRGLGDAPEGAWPDPRHSALGWRAYRNVSPQTSQVDWDALRVTHLIPESGIELGPDTFILEAGFERLNGVDFRKGCYVGQEVTARMKHKTELRKGLARVSITGSAAPGTPLLNGGKAAGTLFTQSGGSAIAYLRFDRADSLMHAETALVRYSSEEN